MKKRISLLLILLLAFGNISFILSQTEYNLIYDANGNLISGFGLNYSYNGFNQLINITDSSDGSLVEEYFYDHEGSRVFKREYFADGSNQSTFYVSENFVQIRNDSGVFNETYYYDENDLVAKKDNDGNMFYYHPDHLGSTTLVTNESGDVVEETAYLPYGELIEGGEDRYLFTGKEKDVGTGLMYYGARYYDSYLRHFIQPDSLLPDVYDPQQLNRYAYARNNPYRYVDPSGEFSISFLSDPIKGIVEMFSQVIEGIKSWWKSDVNVGLKTGLELTGISDVGRVTYGTAGMMSYDKEFQKLAGTPTFGEYAKMTGEGAIWLGMGAVGGKVFKGIKASDQIKDVNKIRKIMHPKHEWGKVVEDPDNWQEISKIIDRVMKEGKIDPNYGGIRGGAAKVLNIKGEKVRVTFNKETYQLGDAWVETK